MLKHLSQKEIISSRKSRRSSWWSQACSGAITAAGARGSPRCPGGEPALRGCFSCTWPLFLSSVLPSSRSLLAFMSPQPVLYPGRTSSYTPASPLSRFFFIIIISRIRIAPICIVGYEMSGTNLSSGTCKM